jgi:hypothetical protein
MPHLAQAARKSNGHSSSGRSSAGAHQLLAFAVVIVCSGRVAAGQPGVASEIKRQASGSFVFTDSGSHHPITVWFCRPPLLGTDTRIAFIMHGSESQTARQACDRCARAASAECDRACAAVLRRALPTGRVHVR